MRRTLAAGCMAVTACASGSAGEGRAGAPAELARRWHYEAKLNEDLTQVDATLCFEGPVPAELRAGKDEAAVQLRYARWLSPGPKKRLPVQGGRIQLDPRAHDACVAYGVDLRETAKLGNAVLRVGSDVMASPNVWLWRPEVRSSQSSASLHLELPSTAAAALPFSRNGTGYQLGPDAFAYNSYAAFGRFRRISGEQKGVAFEAALLEGAMRADDDAIQRWLRGAIGLAETGPFPSANHALHVIIVPVSDAAEPVAFGSVARGGEGSVLLFVSSRASEEELQKDWVLPHELSHLFMPFLGPEHAWLSEGLASYYQEVLRARAGVISPERALLNLAEALRSARNEGTGRVLSEESRAMHQTRAYRAVYWAGAAYFLIADVELRRRSAGKLSLDSVLARLAAEGESQRWSRDEFLARLDQLAGMQVFQPLAADCLTHTFPDFEPTLQALGVSAPDAAPKLAPDAALADVRASLFAPQPRR